MVSSYYEALPIFRAAMDLAVRIDKAVQLFPRRHKYTLGAKLRDASERIVVMVARANRRSERAKWLEALCNQVEDLKLLTQLGKEVQAFASFSAFVEVMEQVVALARQAEGWRRSAASQNRPEPARGPSTEGR